MLLLLVLTSVGYFSGPRFVLNLIRVFEGSFGGSTLYENPQYQSPNEVNTTGDDYYDWCVIFKTR